jgi:hypothetical protein
MKTLEDKISSEFAPIKADIAVLKWGMGLLVALNISMFLKLFFG